MALTITVKVEDEGVKRALRESRRDIDKDVRRELKDAAEIATLPIARSLGPSFAASTFAIRAGRRQVSLTTKARGMTRRIVGLLEFGGTVRTTILPRRAKALAIPGIGFRAAVRGPRRYRAKRFMQTAAERSRPRVERLVEAKLTALVQARVDGARR